MLEWDLPNGWIDRFIEKYVTQFAYKPVEIKEHKPRARLLPPNLGVLRPPSDTFVKCGSIPKNTPVAHAPIPSAADFPPMKKVETQKVETPIVEKKNVVAPNEDTPIVEEQSEVFVVQPPVVESTQKVATYASVASTNCNNS